MDDLLREFLTEAGEHLDTVDSELVRFEQSPDDVAILRNIFRLVHTIKGTCGFLGLPRLEALTHAAEALMGKLRDGAPVTSEAVTLILATIDRIRLMLAELAQNAAEPEGHDRDIITDLERAVAGTEAGTAPPPPRPTARGAAAPAAVAAPAHAALAAPAPAAVAAPAVADRGASVPAPAEPAVHVPQTIRVGVDTLEHLMTMVSELVLTRNQLLDIARRETGEGGFKLPLQRLSHVTAELQDGIMKTRMQPIGSVWAKLPRVVRELAADLGKKFELVVSGAETELDRQVLELIRDPLTHMIRNAADHGIEAPAERVRLGKPAQGTIRVHAFHEGGTITIEISDDGRGLNHDAIRRRAAELGIATEAELARMADGQVSTLVFHPGFSTAVSVTTVSGRGMGMDVVRSNIASIGGTVDIESKAGRGSTFIIKIPLTLAIVAALIVSAGDQRLAMPQVAVVELVRVDPGSDHRLERIHGAPVLRLRDDLLPVIDLAGLLGLTSPDAGREDGFVVVTAVGRQRFGILVDSVLETEEIVVKPLSSRLKHLSVFGGNTILGDGGVVLILDPNGIGRAIGSDQLRTVGEFAPAARVASEAEETCTLLVFRGAGPSLKAVPLSLVSRLEEVDAAAIEEVGGRACIQYRGRLMPLVDMAGGIRQSGSQPVIVVSEGGRPLGLAVGEIVDVVETALAIEPVADRPDLVGSAIVRGRATEIVDLASYLPDFGAEAPTRLDARSATATVLLVDDNAFFRELLAPVIRAAGYRVRTAASAAEALAIAASFPIAAAVIDCDLPDRSGLDLVAEIRDSARGRGIAAVLLASTVNEAMLDRAGELGVHDVVAKFDRPGLMAALAESETPTRLDLAA